MPGRLWMNMDVDVHLTVRCWAALNTEHWQRKGWREFGNEVDAIGGSDAFLGEKQSASKNSFDCLYTSCKAKCRGVKSPMLAFSFLSLCWDRLSKWPHIVNMVWKIQNERCRYSCISAELDSIPAMLWGGGQENPLDSRSPVRRQTAPTLAFRPAGN